MRVVAAVLDLGGAALQLGQLEEPGLVEVDEAAAFGVGGLELAVQAGQLGAEHLVVGGAEDNPRRVVTPPLPDLSTGS